MDALVAPDLGALAEQRGMGRPAERGAPAVSDQAVADVIVDRDQMPCRRRCLDDGADFGGELRADPLVGVDLHDPGAAADRDARMTPRPFPLPGALDDAIGELQRDIARAVAAAVEHDDNFVGKTEAGQTLGELGFLVMRDDQRRQPRRWTLGSYCRFFYGEGHAPPLSARCHRCRATASAA